MRRLTRFTQVFTSRIFTRYYSGHRLVFSEFGDPSSVLRLEEYQLDPRPGQVVVKMLAAPVNPADVNVIQGIYPIKPSAKDFPAVPGNEGVGLVISSSSEKLVEGDLVLPVNRGGYGTWQEYICRDAADLIPINNNIDLIAAATLSVNPPTALRMLMDFEKLKPNETVVQNGGNSGVGRSVIQLASVLGLRTISIIRNRPDVESLRRELEDMGEQSIVMTEEEFREAKDLPKCQIAFNCVGGKGVIGLLKALDNGRTMVTYGGMSKQPLIVPTSSLIFNDINVRGFWMTRWKSTATTSQILEMFDFLSGLYLDRRLTPPKVETLKLLEYQKAFTKDSSGKYVFLF